MCGRNHTAKTLVRLVLFPFSLLYILNKRDLRGHHVVSVCVYPFQLLNRLTYFHEIWYERYASGGHLNFLFFVFLKLLITTWRTHELMRWE